MNAYQIGGWIERHDSQRRMTTVQLEIIKSALWRDDVKKAKRLLTDWKILT